MKIRTDHHPPQRIDERVPGGGFKAVPPERIAEMPGRQLPVRHPSAFNLPGPKDVACQLAGEIRPEALSLGRGAHVFRRADIGMMDIEMFRGVVRVRNGGKQEFPDVPLPRRAPVNQFVPDDEYSLTFHAQHNRQQRTFPGSQVSDHEDLP